MNDFRDIIGHEGMLRNLRGAIIHDRINHAYLLEGDEGSGKGMVAEAFAKALQCEARGPEGYACGQCVSCLSFDSLNHPDVFRVAATKTKAIGVDDIREQITREIATKPYRCRYKIFIMEHAETMSVSAQNALLKTLEEPAPYGIFLLTAANSSQLLPTILSRCVTLKMKPLPLPLVRDYLMDRLGLPEDKALFISIYAGGSIGQALQAAGDEQFAEMRQHTIRILDGISRRDLAEVFLLAKELEALRDHISDILHIAFLWYRDLAVLKEFGDDTLVWQKDMIGPLQQNRQLDIGTLYKHIEALWDAKMQLRANANFQMVTEVLLMKLNEE